MDNTIFCQFKSTCEAIEHAKQNGNVTEQRLKSLELCKVLLKWESEQPPLTSGLISLRLNAHWQPIGEFVLNRLTQLISHYSSTNQSFSDKLMSIKADIIAGEKQLNIVLEQIKAIRAEMMPLARDLRVNETSVSEMSMTLESLEQKQKMLIEIQRFNQSLEALTLDKEAFEKDIKNGQLPEKLMELTRVLLEQYNEIMVNYRLHVQENEQIAQQLSALTDTQQALKDIEQVKNQLKSVDQLLGSALQVLNENKPVV